MKRDRQGQLFLQCGKTQYLRYKPAGRKRYGSVFKIIAAAVGKDVIESDNFIEIIQRLSDPHQDHAVNRFSEQFRSLIYFSKHLSCRE